MSSNIEISTNGISYKGSEDATIKTWSNVLNPNPPITQVNNNNLTYYPTFVLDNSNNQVLYVNKSSSTLSYKPSLGELSATKFIGEFSGNAATATRLANSVNIGGVPFDGSVAINLPGVNIDGTRNTSGNAATATMVNISETDNSTLYYPTFTSGFGGNYPLYVDAQLTKMTYEPNTGQLTSSKFIGDLLGNASTAIRLANSVNIGGVSFDGSVPINLPGVNIDGTQSTTGNAATATRLETARTIGGVSFDGTADIVLPGVNSDGTQNTSGNAATATNVNIIDVSYNNTNVVFYPTFTSDNSGNFPLYVDKELTAMYYVPSSGELTAVKFIGNLQGGVTGNVTGNVIGDVSGNVIGNLLGNVTGQVTGPVTGNVTGDVTGNVTGHLLGDVSGNLQGDVKGNVTGDVTGNVIGHLSGDVSGNLQGDVKGNVTGDVTGNLTGSVNGDVSGNLFGNVSGNVSGHLLGDVSGNLQGNVTGKVNGDVKGYLLGNVTGNVSGNVDGHLLGDVSGNLQGYVFGDVLGNVTGDLFGNVTGHLQGDVSGNLQGDVSGNVTGNLVGSVFGKAYGDIYGNMYGSMTGDLSGNLTSNLIDAIPTTNGTITLATKNDITSPGLILSGNSLTANLTGNESSANKYLCLNINGTNYKILLFNYN